MEVPLTIPVRRNAEVGLMVLDRKYGARLRVLLLVALVGSLLAGPAIPVAGQEREPEHTATYSACVGSATDPAGFNDVTWYPAASRAAIDCLAHYDITQGNTAGDFDPTGVVTRWQMALFLVRAAGPAGIDIPRPSDQGFRDIAVLPGYIQDAIDQLAALEITKGTAESRFSPHNVVTRRQMAHFLARFLDAAPVGPGGFDIEDVKPDDEAYFQDLAGVPRPVHDVIATLFEMGVTAGTSSTRFSPDQPVTRVQMALFITRTLAHTNARPAGLTLQSATRTVTAGQEAPFAISLRDSSHGPVLDQPVDIFFAVSRKEAFDDEGKCTTKVMADLGEAPCVIDVNDETTDPDGNVIYEVFVDAGTDEDQILWAWTGERFDEFDLDTTTYVSVDFGTVKPATHILVKDDLHSAATKVPYGTAVTFSFQLVNEDKKPVTQGGVKIEIRTGEERGEEAVGRPRTRPYYTDSEGEVEFSYQVRDPGSHRNGDDTLLTIEVLDSSDLEIIDESAVGVVGDGERSRADLPWSADEKAPSVLVLELPTRYHLAGAGGRGATNRVTATLVDQYGDPVRGKVIHFKSGDMDGLWEDPDDGNLAKETNREETNVRGEATTRYFRDSDRAGTETIMAFVEDEPDVPQAEKDHYWVTDAPTGTGLSSYEVKVHEKARNTLVIDDGGGPYVVTYDPEDQFNSPDGTETYESFKENLEEGDIVDVRVQSHAVSATNYFERRNV